VKSKGGLVVKQKGLTLVLVIILIVVAGSIILGTTFFLGVSKINQRYSL